MLVILMANCLAFPVLAQDGKTSSGDAYPNRAFFGETHIHTSWSFDAYVYGNTTTGPDDAYKFALGQTIKHPGGYDIKITKPLDFMAVTDHCRVCGHSPPGE